MLGECLRTSGLRRTVGVGQPWKQGEPRLFCDSMSEGTRRETRLCVVIHHHVIALQMRTEGGQKYITAMFPPRLCFLNRVEKLEFKHSFNCVALRLSGETNRPT